MCSKGLIRKLAARHKKGSAFCMALKQPNRGGPSRIRHLRMHLALKPLPLPPRYAHGHAKRIWLAKTPNLAIPFC